MANLSSYNSEAFSRNFGIISGDEQARITQTTIAIIGLGGVGGIYATSLARLGFSKFHIADPDIFELANMNRQAGAFGSTIGERKVDAIKALLLDINPFADVTIFPEGMTENNAGEILDGVDIALDGIDFFSIKARRLFFGAARARNIPVLTAGPIGYGASMLVFLPYSMSFDAYFDIHDDCSDEEMILRFGIGICPALLQRAYFKPAVVNLTDQSAPSTVSGTLSAANLITTEVLRMIRMEDSYPAPHSIQFDPQVRALRRVWMPMGNRNPIQKFKMWIVRRQLRKGKVRI